MSTDERVDVQPLGPRPSSLRRDPLTNLSTPRANVLEQLARFGTAVPVTTLAEACHQHPNTVREHLDALLDAGLVTRSTSLAKGRGRPAILYQVLTLDLMRPQLREYALLAGAFAKRVTETEADPRAWGLAAGEARGRELVTPTAMGPEAAFAAIRDLKVLHGFDPVLAEDGTIHVRECPLLEVARAYPQVVCGVHQGILNGIYAAHGVSAAKAMRITEFALPGCCVIDMPAGTDDVLAPGDVATADA